MENKENNVTKWEYSLLFNQTGDGYQERITQKLNELGEKGWELVTHTSSGSHFIFKRKK